MRVPPIALGVLLAASSACSYCDDRLRDAGDIFTVVGGIGGGAKARVGPINAGLLFAADQIGWKGGHSMSPWEPPARTGDMDLQLVLFGMDESQRGFHDGRKRPKAHMAPNLIFTLPTIGHGAEFPEDPSYLTQIEVVLGAGGTLRLGFNPGELLDFLLGIFGVDLFGDDDRKSEKVGPDKPAEPKKEE
jgi:hypothetical protein